MPISLSASVRRVLGAAAFVATIAVSVWLFSVKNSAKTPKKKKKELHFEEESEKETTLEDKVEFVAEEKEEEEVGGGKDFEVVQMEVLVQNSVEEAVESPATLLVSIT
jgi:hypothetical protein